MDIHPNEELTQLCSTNQDNLPKAKKSKIREEDNMEYKDINENNNTEHTDFGNGQPHNDALIKQIAQDINKSVCNIEALIDLTISVMKNVPYRDFFGHRGFFYSREIEAFSLAQILREHSLRIAQWVMSAADGEMLSFGSKIGQPVGTTNHKGEPVETNAVSITVKRIRTATGGFGFKIVDFAPTIQL